MQTIKVVTAGHRGGTTGANGFISEASEAIRFRDAVVSKMKQKAIIDGNAEKLGDLIKRINAIQGKKIAIEFHFDASENSLAHGCTAFVHENTSIENKNRALELIRLVERSTTIYNRGVKYQNQGQHSRLAYLEDLSCESIILELCFVTNAQDTDLYLKNFTHLTADMAKMIDNW